MTELVIDRLAHLGDGVTDTDRGPVFVPFTLPGERVRVGAIHKSRAALEEIMAPSPDRVDPVCSHFGACGGCALQHVSTGQTAIFKRDVVLGALDGQGVKAECVHDTLSVPLESRRRVSLKAVWTRDGIILGFAERASHTVINLSHCPVAAPHIVSALPALRDLFRTLFSERSRADLHVTASETGLDLDLRMGREPSLDDRFDLADLAEAHDWARLSWNGEIISERRAPLLTIGGVAVHLPVGGFLQASADTDRLFAEHITKAVAGRKRVLDLFSGVGTIALALAKSHAVAAIEGDKAACHALRQAADGAAGAGRINPVKVLKRDLFRRPLMAAELKGLDAIMFDPPRAGAEAQCREMAQSTVPLIVGVSCDPKSFARDARLLCEGGYKLKAVTPIDQFRFSPHVEMIGVFER